MQITPRDFQRFVNRANNLRSIRPRWSEDKILYESLKKIAPHLIRHFRYPPRKITVEGVKEYVRDAHTLNKVGE